MTTYGVIGVKVWIFKGEVFEKAELERQAAEGEAAARSGCRSAAGPQRAAPRAPAEAPAQA